jgi:predicted double-glycine peptidase
MAKGSMAGATSSNNRPEQVMFDVPYYPQTLEFTCGAAALAMALKVFLPELKLDRRLELRLWREATLVFMTSGLGGCGPFGMAVAAVRRGMRAAVIMSKERTPFLSGVRDNDKKEIIRICHKDLREEARRLGVREAFYNFGVEDLREGLRQGAIPILLISTYRQYREKSPHYVTLTGFKGDRFYFNDPYKRLLKPSSAKGKNMWVTSQELTRMKQYGRDLDKSVTFIYPPGVRFPWPPSPKSKTRLKQ